MIRHPDNTNLIFHRDSTFLGWPIQEDKGPFIQQYLHRLLETMQYALAEYPRVFAFRVDLRLPMGIPLPDYAYTNQVIEYFIASFKAKIKHNRSRACVSNPYAHDFKVRYFWVREHGQQGKPHYHLAILLNRDAFNCLGWFNSDRDNMFNRLQEAWASALGLSIGEVRGLVESPRKSIYKLNRGDLEGQTAFFSRTSYMCKSATKVFEDGSHAVGCSRS